MRDLAEHNNAICIPCQVKHQISKKKKKNMLEHILKKVTKKAPYCFSVFRMFHPETLPFVLLLFHTNL